MLVHLSIFTKTVAFVTSRQFLGPPLTSSCLSYALGPDPECKKVKWCAIGHQERTKCDEWSVNSDGKIECESAETTEDCIAKITVCHSCPHRVAPLPLRAAGPSGSVNVSENDIKTMFLGTGLHRESPAPQELHDFRLQIQGLLRAPFSSLFSTPRRAVPAVSGDGRLDMVWVCLTQVHRGKCDRTMLTVSTEV